MSETASSGSAQVPSGDAPPSPTPPTDAPAASSVASGADAGTDDAELVDPLLALARRTPWPGSALTGSVRPLTKDGAAACADSVRELDDKVKAAIAGHPAGRIEYPPAFFTLPMPGSSDSHSVVGIPASIEDYTAGANMRDCFGGLESIFPVEHLSDAELRDVARLLGLDDGEGVSNSVLVPRGDRSEWPPRVFQDVVDSTRAKRELASLVRAFGCERLAARVFGTSTALHRAVKELREFQGATQRVGPEEREEGCRADDRAIYYNGNLVDWGSKKQPMVTLSSTESEYIVMASGVQECIRLMMVSKDLGIKIGEIVVL